jgi:plasmid stabilization system protein ParE
MKSRPLVFLPEAQGDLDDLYEWIADSGGERIARHFVDRLRTFCDNIALAPERGQRRDDLMPGLRFAGYRRRATIAFTIEERAVVIIRVLYRGRDVDALFRRAED